MTLIRFEALPEGVWPIRDYPSLGGTLVECDHARLVPLIQGGDLCPVCKASGASLALPVKLLVVVAGGAPQGSLF